MNFKLSRYSILELTDQIIYKVIGKITLILYNTIDIILKLFLLKFSTVGRMAELVDALGSGSSVRKDLGVQIPLRPPTKKH